MRDIIKSLFSAVLFAALLIPGGAAIGQQSYSDQIFHKRYEFGSDFVEDDWLPYRKGTIEQTWDPPAAAGVTAEAKRTYTLAQRTAMQNNMRELHSVVMTSPLLANLQGVGARVYGALGVSRESFSNWPDFVNAPHLYLSGHMSINMNPYVLLDGKTSFYHEYWRPLMLKANNMSMLVVNRPIFEGYDYIEYTPPLYEWFGHPVYVEQHLMGYTLLKAIVTNKGIPIHKPVTYREFMTAALENLSKFDRDSMQASQEKLFVQMEQEIEKGYREMLKYEATRAMAGQVRTESLKSIQDMKIQAGKDLESEGSRKLYAMIAQYRQALASWSAAELDAPCKITHEEESGIATVFPQGEHDGWIDVVRPNPDLVDRNRPTDVQLLTVLFPEYAAVKDEELGYYRHYWIINRMLEDWRMWQMVFDKVKK